MSSTSRHSLVVTVGVSTFHVSRTACDNSVRTPSERSPLKLQLLLIPGIFGSKHTERALGVALKSRALQGLPGLRILRPSVRDHGFNQRLIRECRVEQHLHNQLFDHFLSGAGKWPRFQDFVLIYKSRYWQPPPNTPDWKELLVLQEYFGERVLRFLCAPREVGRLV
jgi:hypothetical protein